MCSQIRAISSHNCTFFANGSFLYNTGNAEQFRKATVCRAIRKVSLAHLLHILIVFPGHKTLRTIKEEFHRIADDWCRNHSVEVNDNILNYILLITFCCNLRLGSVTYFSFYFAGFPNVVGCINSSHIPIIVPSVDEGNYANRKSFHSIMCRYIDYCLTLAKTIKNNILQPLPYLSFSALLRSYVMQHTWLWMLKPSSLAESMTHECILSVPWAPEFRMITKALYKYNSLISLF